MKYLHIKLCGKAFPHLDKVIKNKKKKILFHTGMNL